MGNGPIVSTHRRLKRQKSAWWPALAGALVFHLLVLLLPWSGQGPVSKPGMTGIDVELTTLSPAEPLPQTEVTEAFLPPTDSQSESPAVDKTLQSITATGVEPTAPVTPSAEQIKVLSTTRENEDEPVDRQRMNAILARQFISEGPVAGRLFGRAIESENDAAPVDFQLPQRASLIEQLRRPLPDLPFAYTPGLVHFAYAPGIKGDLQRFWDVITPEFGWKTNNGTEVKCILILVIAGCAWK